MVGGVGVGGGLFQSEKMIARGATRRSLSFLRVSVLLFSPLQVFPSTHQLQQTCLRSGSPQGKLLRLVLINGKQWETCPARDGVCTRKRAKRKAKSSLNLVQEAEICVGEGAE